MSGFKALLIGIDKYEDENIRDFDGIIEQDFASISSTLKDVGYRVESLVGTKAEPLGKFKLVDKIGEFFGETAEYGDTLLLYLSGHGIHLTDNNKSENYLVPSDANLKKPHTFSERFLALDFEPLLLKSKAQNAIVFVDACREAFDFQPKSLEQYKLDDRIIRENQNKSYLIIFGCTLGNEAFTHKGTSESFSLMAKAFIDSVSNEHIGASVEEILTATDIRIKELACELKTKIQDICYHKQSLVGDDGLGQLLLYPGEAQLSQEENPWLKAVELHELWDNHTNSKSQFTIDGKSAVMEVVEACWRDFQGAKKCLPDNPWWNESFAVRVTEQVSELFAQLNDHFKPGVSEIMLTLVTAFVRESLVATELLTFEDTKLNEISEGFTPANEAEQGLEIILKSHAPLVRKTQQLWQQQLNTAHTALAYWLIYKTTKRSINLWQVKEDSHLKQALEKISLRGQSKEIFNEKRLTEFARILIGDPERISVEDRDFIFQDSVKFGGASDDRLIREKSLAYTLQVAGMTAIECTALPDLLVDHIGLSDPLNVEDILSLLSAVQWKTNASTWNISVRCSHPALDHSLEKYAEQCNQVLDKIHFKVSQSLHFSDTISRLPIRISCESVQPFMNRGIPVYQKPHVHFHLKQQQVQQLLMGTKLYGDASLAIRELYQNALDACRYREARLKYLKAKNPNCDFLDKWQPEIRFFQGEDDNGREFIECYDSGIGMSIQDFINCFAQAGHKFHDSPQFIEEQQQWRKDGIQIFPNSQFGVGVFSYFMLADEIHITSARMDKKGSFSNRISAKISSNGSLFRVKEEPAANVQGTSVKLYLKQDTKVSVFATLTELLWVADYPTYVKQGKQAFQWKPGILNSRHKTFLHSNFLTTDDANFWWHDPPPVAIEDDYSITLCDGILTKAPINNLDFCIINLKQECYPNLTVDRTSIISEDKCSIQKLLNNKLHEHKKSLLNGNFVTWSWLTRLAKRNNYFAESIIKELNESDTKVRIDQRVFSENSISIKNVGVYKEDVKVIGNIIKNNNKLSHKIQQCNILKDFYNYGFSESPPNWLMQHRKSMWQNIILDKNHKYFFKNKGGRDRNINLRTIYPKDSQILAFEPGELTWKKQLYICLKNQESLNQLKDRILRLGPTYTLKNGLSFNPELKPQKHDFNCLDALDQVSLEGLLRVSITEKCSVKLALRKISHSDIGKTYVLPELSKQELELMESEHEFELFKSLGFDTETYYDNYLYPSHIEETQFPITINISRNSLRSKANISKNSLKVLLKKFIATGLLVGNFRTVNNLAKWYETCTVE